MGETLMDIQGLHGVLEEFMIDRGLKEKFSEKAEFFHPLQILQIRLILLEKQMC